MTNVAFTIDLEDPYEEYARDGRYVERARYILELCDTLERKATFFTVGRVAEAAPDLVAEIARRGHEVAYHSHAHVALTEERPERFARETAADKKRIEDVTGQPLAGFRAPRFSLTPQSVWALDVLKDQGFLYSSSIMPTRLSLFGFQNVPAHAFHWPNGLIELPLPTAPLFGDFRIAYLGGIYMYLMPDIMTRHFIRSAHENEILWTYTHPYDFDRTEPLRAMPHTLLWAMLILRLGRFFAEEKIRRLLRNSSGTTLVESIKCFSRQ